MIKHYLVQTRIGREGYWSTHLVIFTDRSAAEWYRDWMIITGNAPEDGARIVEAFTYDERLAKETWHV